MSNITITLRRAQGINLSPERRAKRRVKGLIVEYQPLVGKKKIKLGKPIKKEILWDKKIVPKIKIGDWISFHWGQLAQVLTKNDMQNLKKYTLETLNSLQ